MPVASNGLTGLDGRTAQRLTMSVPASDVMTTRVGWQSTHVSGGGGGRGAPYPGGSDGDEWNGLALAALASSAAAIVVGAAGAPIARAPQASSHAASITPHPRFPRVTAIPVPRPLPSIRPATAKGGRGARVEGAAAAARRERSSSDLGSEKKAPRDRGLGRTSRSAWRASPVLRARSRISPPSAHERVRDLARGSR